MYRICKRRYNKKKKAGGFLLFPKNAEELKGQIQSYLKRAMQYSKKVMNRVKETDFSHIKEQAKKQMSAFCMLAEEKTMDLVTHDKVVGAAKKMKVNTIYAVSSGMLAFLLLCSVAGSNLTFGYRVVADGEVVGVTAHKEEAQRAADAAIAELKLLKNTETPVSAVEIERSLASKRAIQSEAEMQESFVVAFDARLEGFGIFVNGSLVTATATEAEAQEVLERYKLEFVNDATDQTSVGFNKSVEILSATVRSAMVQNVDDALLALKAPEEKVITHVIVEGDNFYDLAIKYHTTQEKLLAYNPDVKPELLQLGQEINVTANTPVLQVQTKEHTTAVENFDYPTEKIDDPDSYEGVSIVTKEGVPGEKQVEYEVVKENGVEVGRTALSETVLKEPVTAVVKVGTKKRPSTASTGTFATPFYGVVTSRFGSRWGGTHTGIDLAGPTGSSVIAADGGTVTFAGWSGGYGKLIKIKHDNGYETYYAHLSSINVKVGQKVAKKEFIGKVGNTGNSTGPHLHFEIRKNGKALNPANYMR